MPFAPTIYVSGTQFGESKDVSSKAPTRCTLGVPLLLSLAKGKPTEASNRIYRHGRLAQVRRTETNSPRRFSSEQSGSGGNHQMPHKLRHLDTAHEANGYNTHYPAMRP